MHPDTQTPAERIANRKSTAIVFITGFRKKKVASLDVRKKLSIRTFSVLASFGAFPPPH